jgi:hypothetical protein
MPGLIHKYIFPSLSISFYIKTWFWGESKIVDSWGVQKPWAPGYQKNTPELWYLHLADSDFLLANELLSTHGVHIKFNEWRSKQFLIAHNSREVLVQAGTGTVGSDGADTIPLPWICSNARWAWHITFPQGTHVNQCSWWVDCTHLDKTGSSKWKVQVTSAGQGWGKMLS